MRISDLAGAAAQGVFDYDFQESGRLRKASQEQVAEAVQKVEEVQEANNEATLVMMDNHNDMVKKSQELAKEKDKKRAIERQSQKHKEEHTELLAEMAIRNAERRDLLEASRLKG